MSDDEVPFLSRWSRRKVESREENAAPPAEAKPAQVPAEVEKPLPPVETLTPESDFKPFMGANVEPGTRREALKKLFADPHYNVHDPFEAYMEDYTKSDPITPEMLKRLDHARHVLFEEKSEVAKATEQPPAETAEPQPDPKDGAAKQDA